MRNLALLAFVAAVCLPAPLLAQDPAASGASTSIPAMNLEQTMLLRCSAAFAVIASEQQRGIATADTYPPLQKRGKEFFVRAGASLMDELGLTREQVRTALTQEVGRLQAETMASDKSGTAVAAIMEPCLQQLAALGL